MRTRTGTTTVLAIFVVLATVLMVPRSVQAYVGPGAGFAFLSSFLTLFLAFLYSLFALLTWPLRHFYRMVRRRHAYGKAKAKRVVIIGLDGMDPDLAARYMNEGKLPHLARLRDEGTFRRLATTCPPISPVAWSSFMTGVNPGKHNIYDFLARDTGNYLPYLSSAQIRNPKRSLKIGKYAIPLGKPQIKLLRKSVPFWHLLGKAGVFSSVIRVPITFPPEKFSGVLLSGMCVPDLLGSQGTFSFYSSRDSGVERHQGGTRIPLERNGQRFRSYVVGPQNPLLRKGKQQLRIPFTVHTDVGNEHAQLEIEGHRLPLRKGEYSPWVELKFKAGLGIRLHGICRFFLKAIEPHLELYASPINIHPAKPALPISHPLSYSIYLAKLLGPYATLGLAEDTWALNEGVLDDEAFLKQSYLIHEERERMFFDALEKTARGVCVCVFDITDRVQHMFWRYLDPSHPALKNTARDPHCAGVIEELYRRMDEMIGRVFRQIDDAILLVVSDHGFKSFARGVNVNSWLCHNGYLTLKNGARESGEWLQNVDWEKTRAYALGLNGLYVNQKSREIHGSVPAGVETEKLKRELREKLQSLVEPETGHAVIRCVFDSRAVFVGPYSENAPDLIIGYSEGYRASWHSVTGKVTEAILEENCKAWSGDHCIDPELVPGVLFSNRKLVCDDPAIIDVAPTVLDLFGVGIPSHMDGKPWEIRGQAT